MARNKTKRVIVGYGAWINRTGEKSGWERVGFLFAHRGAAKSFLFYDVRVPYKASKVQAIRSSAAPFVVTKEMQAAA